MVAVVEDLPSMETRYPVLHGKGDPILDYPEHGGTVAKKIPCATIHLIVDAGHKPPLVLPDRTAAFIKDVARRIG